MEINCTAGSISVLFPEKVWAHRVNTKIKLAEAADKFTGVQLDIVINKDNFDVNHPPVESIDLSLK